MLSAKDLPLSASFSAVLRPLSTISSARFRNSLLLAATNSEPSSAFRPISSLVSFPDFGANRSAVTAPTPRPAKKTITEDFTFLVSIFESASYAAGKLPRTSSLRQEIIYEIDRLDGLRSPPQIFRTQIVVNQLRLHGPYYLAQLLGRDGFQGAEASEVGQHFLYRSLAHSGDFQQLAGKLPPSSSRAVESNREAMRFV